MPPTIAIAERETLVQGSQPAVEVTLACVTHAGATPGASAASAPASRLAAAATTPAPSQPKALKLLPGSKIHGGLGIAAKQSAGAIAQAPAASKLPKGVLELAAKAAAAKGNATAAHAQAPTPAKGEKAKSGAHAPGPAGGKAKKAAAKGGVPAHAPAAHAAAAHGAHAPAPAGDTAALLLPLTPGNFFGIGNVLTRCLCCMQLPRAL